MKTKPSKKVVSRKKAPKAPDKQKTKKVAGIKTFKVPVVKTLTRAIKHIKKAEDRNEQRQAAIESAAALLHKMGYFFDMGGYLLIISRAKLILAFDLPESLVAGLEKSAATTKHSLLYVEPARFNHKDLTQTVMNALQLQSEQVIPPKKLRRSKKVSKVLDRNLAKV